MRWKNELCALFEKKPLKESLEEVTREMKMKMRGNSPSGSMS